MRKFVRWLIISITLSVLCIVSIFAMRRLDTKKYLEPISEQINIEPTWEAYQSYMNKTFVVGMSQSEVHKYLEQVDYKINSEFVRVRDGCVCQVIELPTGETYFFPRLPLAYSFCFSPEDDSLKNWTLYPG